MHLSVYYSHFIRYAQTKICSSKCAFSSMQLYREPCWSGPQPGSLEASLTPPSLVLPVSSEQRFPEGGALAHPPTPTGHLGSVWRQFWLPHSEAGATLISWRGARDDVKYTSMHGTALHNKELTKPKCQWCQEWEILFSNLKYSPLFRSWWSSTYIETRPLFQLC